MDMNKMEYYIWKIFVTMLIEKIWIHTHMYKYIYIYSHVHVCLKFAMCEYKKNWKNMSIYKTAVVYRWRDYRTVILCVAHYCCCQDPKYLVNSHSGRRIIFILFHCPHLLHVFYREKQKDRCISRNPL